MSEPKLISPLLDGFLMGDPISDHGGVRSCPAMRANTEEKYIVKIISVPASQTKLDALLLAGAFQDSESALGYFKDLATGVVKEAEILQQLSRLEGFESFEGWQIVPMDEGEVGYDVYLTGTYRTTLDRIFRHESITHLAAVNLGLDLCAALAACRRSGYLYVALKPDNVYVGQDNVYRIGDLGFLSLSSLAYASMPERYLSSYTAPEICDAYSAINETLDVYAAGLILYQAYNGGVLPFEGRATDEPLSAPQYADAEIAQIILRACDPNPEVRWQDPQQMGQALAAYLQSNVVNDTPIAVAPQSIIPEELQGDPAEQQEDLGPSTDEILAEVDDALAAAGVTEEDLAISKEEPSEEEPSEEEFAEGETSEEAPTQEKSAEETPEASEEETEEPPVEAENLSQAEEAPCEQAVNEDDSHPAEELGVTEEVSEILAQAETIIAHELPEPVVVPEHIDLPEPASADGNEEETTETPEEAEPLPEDDCVQEESFEEETQPPVRKKRGLLIAVISALLVAALALGGYLFYQNIYLQPISQITANGEKDKLTVTVFSDIPDDLLTVSCISTYGTRLEASVLNGKAYFSGLSPDTSYKIQVEINGFHQLTGKTTINYTTPQQTSVIGLTANTGTEHGSVILSFTVQGPDGNWVVHYSADGEDEQSLAFSGHMVTVTGLTIGKEYTFRLEPEKAVYLVGADPIAYTVQRPVYAENLKILGFRDGALHIAWNKPEDADDILWTVRCYNSDGCDKTLTTENLECSFADLDITKAYTIEVTATGMTQGVRAFLSENSVTVNDLSVTADRNELTVTWSSEGETPEGGWVLIYTLNDDKQEYTVTCGDATTAVVPKLPGYTYHFSVEPANGNTAIGGTLICRVEAAEPFSGYWVSNTDMEFKMCKTPAKEQWTQYDVPASDYKTTFAAGEKASFAVRLMREYTTSNDQITTLFVIRDADGKLVSTDSYTKTWTSMWYRGFGRVNIPVMPETAGEYTVDIYFSGAFVTTQNFSIT